MSDLRAQLRVHGDIAKPTPSGSSDVIMLKSQVLRCSTLSYVPRDPSLSGEGPKRDSGHLCSVREAGQR